MTLGLFFLIITVGSVAALLCGARGVYWLGRGE